MSAVDQHGTASPIGGVFDAEVVHGEIVEVVREQYCAMGSCRACDKSIGRVNRTASFGPRRLILAGAAGRLPIGEQEPKSVEKGRCPSPLARSQPPLDLGQVYARRGQRVSLAQASAQTRRDRRCVPQVADEDGRVEDVDGQDASSVRRWARTHSLIESWSLNSG